MKATITRELVDELIENLNKNKYNNYDIRFYFEGEDPEDEGEMFRINAKLEGSIFSGFTISEIWLG